MSGWRWHFGPVSYSPPRNSQPSGFWTLFWCLLFLVTIIATIVAAF